MQFMSHFVHVLFISDSFTSTGVFIEFVITMNICITLHRVLYTTEHNSKPLTIDTHEDYTHQRPWGTD